MDFLFGLLDSSLVPWILGLLAALVGYKFLSEKVKIRAPVGVNREDLVSRLLGPGWAKKKVEREVARLKKQANYLGAGKLLEEQGRLAEAAEAYLEGQETWAAAATFEKMGRAERAAELFLQAGDHKKGAALFSQAGKPARAAALFLEKGNNLEAARLFAVAGQWSTAAELYEKSGYPLRAAEAWEKDGKPLKAAEAYEKHFTENVSFSTSYSQSQGTPDSKSSLQAGRLYEQAKQLERAANVYTRGGYNTQAAEALLKLGQAAKAAELFLKGEDNEKAALAFEQAGDTVRAATLRGEQAFKTDRPAEAAAWFVKGRDFLRAAELYESVGMMAEAAGAYEAGESWAAAGGVYIRAGLKDKAAAAYEKAGELETAAGLYQELGDASRAGELYGRAGFAFKSGEAAARAGEREKAIALLQRVQHSDENYRAASELLARLFIETGRPPLAIEKMKKAIGNEPISAANLDFHYWLALAHEAAGARAEALDFYKKIQAEDLQYRDVNQRVAKLQAAAPAAPPKPSSAPAARPVPAAAPAAAPATTRVPRFAPKEEIARGPLGVIFRGEDASDGRSVAMRMLNPALLTSAPLVSALAAELKAASQISHPNLVKVIALMEWEGARCVVTEYVAGRNFAEAISSGRKLGFQQVHSLGRVIAQVLALLHQKGLVHGSIRPSNVMVASGVIKVADLGLGRLARAAGLKPSYHAPEGGPSPADDLFALCAVMYHLLTGTHPLSQPQGAGLPLPSQLAPGVPEAMDKLLLRGLHPRPELRLASGEDLQRELREMVKIG
ncbi:MAG TPA: protein kinase [Vicinamibacteria bacterium]|nr:protein kinase [Vicinamibacteria bacterium]